MHNIWLIARREYLERVRAKSFALMTVLIPVLMGGLLYGAAIINGRNSSNAHIAIVTRDAQFGQDLQTELKGEDRGTMSAEVLSPAPALRGQLESRLDHRKLDGYLWITPPARFVEERENLLRALEQASGDLILVSNEVGSGIVPAGAVSRWFVDEAGRLNQDLARICDRALLVVAGLPLVLKAGT